VVAEPPLAEVGATLAANRRRLHAGQEGRAVLGRPWAELRRQARQAAVAAALRYLEGRGERVEIDSGTAADSLLMAGHQPELFHPGVWVKNFALCGLARAHGVTPLNLIVDSDTCKSTALRVPAPEDVRADRPHARLVPFDRWNGEAPYEERAIADPDFFAGFADRAGALLRGWGYDPLLPSFWAEVLRQAGRTPLLGECFAAARRTFERRWGCHNLEVPLSAVCRTEPFAWFTCHLLAHLPRFHALYNGAVGEHRRRHGIRSPNHPVPDLARDGDWLEAPFWGWRAGKSNRRGRLFARQAADRIELRVGADAWPSLPRPEDGQAQKAVAAWQALEAQGLEARTRALTTTLYARLLLADLFMHGIGGGKYDELTDELIRGFYECEPPTFLVLSATLLLPLPRPEVRAEDRRRLVRAVRDVHYNPQRHFAGPLPAELAQAATERETWVTRRPTTTAGRRQRFEALRALTERLQRPLRGEEERLRRELSACERQLAANAVLGRRDYSFCLYPESTLRPFCTQFLDGR
jgi:hypothetical protein